MGKESFVQDYLWPTLAGLALAVLQALSAEVLHGGLEFDGKQLLATAISAAAGYILMIGQRHGGSREPWVQPPKST